MRVLPDVPVLGPTEVHVIAARTATAQVGPPLPPSEMPVLTQMPRRVITRAVLAHYLGVEPAAVPIVRNGRPHVEGHPVEISISSCESWVLIAVTSQVMGAVGVDVEDLRRHHASPQLRRRVLSERERAWVDRTGADAAAGHRRFLWLWVCKEAVVKAEGGPLPGRLSGLDVLGGEVGGWELHDVAPEASAVAALAIRGPVDVRRFRWQP